MASNGLVSGQPNWDWRDQAVLDVLEEKSVEVIGLGDLQSLYQHETDICDKETMKERIRLLVKNGPFEKVGLQKWRFSE